MDVSHSLLARVPTALGLPVARVRRQEGQTFTEYAIITATIAVGTIVSVAYLRDAVTNAISVAANAI